MEKHLITLAGAFIASLFFLSCSEADKDNPSKEINAACKQNNFVSSVEIPEDIDPGCRAEGKKMVLISDLRTFYPEVERCAIYSRYEGGVAANTIYTFNGVEVSEEDCNAYEEEYWKVYYEKLEEHRNLLVIPCLVDSNAVSWTALLSDKEINELLEKHDGQLLFRDPSVYLSSSGGVVTDGSENEPTSADGKARCGS
jgi:hypothetical protein